MKPIKLLNTGRFHESTGDAAIQQVLSHELALRGIPTISSIEASASETAIIGGGWLIIPDGHNDRMLFPFHASGPHILNGVSVSGGHGRYGFLRDYKLVTVRDEASRQLLLPTRDDTKCVPCVTVLAEPPDCDYLANFYGFSFLSNLMLHHDQQYIVCDIDCRDLAKDCDHHVVAVDTRPFMERGIPTFHNRSVDALLACISRSKLVICASLHLSILAMAMGVPFAWPNRGQYAAKGIKYWGRAGFPEACCEVGTDLVNHALVHYRKMLDVRQLERELARNHLDEMTRIVCG